MLFRSDQSALASLELLTNADTIFLQITTAFLGDLAVIIYRIGCRYVPTLLLCLWYCPSPMSLTASCDLIQSQEICCFVSPDYFLNKGAHATEDVYFGGNVCV